MSQAGAVILFQNSPSRIPLCTTTRESESSESTAATTSTRISASNSYETVNDYQVPGNPASNSTFADSYNSTEASINRRAETDTGFEADMAERRPLNQQPQSSNEDFERLKAFSRCQRCVFVFLIVVCVPIILANLIVVFLALRAFHGDLAQSGQWKDKGTAAADNQICVDHRKLLKIQRILDDHTMAELQDFRRNSRSQEILNNHQGKMCFSDLSWMIKFIEEIYLSVSDSVKYIKGNQEVLEEKVNLWNRSSSGNHARRCTAKAVSGPKDKSFDPNHAVFAHFFVDAEKTAKSASQELVPLQFEKERPAASNRRGFDVNIRKGEFTVRVGGFYYVYSHVAFKDANSKPAHIVYKIIKSKSGTPTERKLLETRSAPDSFLQGVFQLNPQDTLKVKVTNHTLHPSHGKATYFGAYLIRT